MPSLLVPSDPAELAALFALDASACSRMCSRQAPASDQAAPAASPGRRRFPQLRPHDDDIASLVLHHPGEVDVGLMGSFVEALLLKNGNDMLRPGASSPCAARPGGWYSAMRHHHRLRLRPRLGNGRTLKTTIVIIGRRLGRRPASAPASSWPAAEPCTARLSWLWGAPEV